MTKQELRNALCLVEDSARELRSKLKSPYSAGRLLGDIQTLTTVIVQLTQLVREEIVK